MYIIFDEEYRVYRSEQFTPQMGRLAGEGRISILDVPDAAGKPYRVMNIDKTWSEINKWDDSVHHYGGICQSP